MIFMEVLISLISINGNRAQTTVKQLKNYLVLNIDVRILGGRWAMPLV